MNRRLSLTLIVAMLILASASRARATFFQNNFGLSDPHSTFTFDEHVLPQCTGVTTQYSDLGVTFSPFAYFTCGGFYGPGCSNVQGNYISDFIPYVGGIGPITISFSSTITEASFALLSANAQTTFQAFLNGNVVASDTVPTGDANNDCTYSGNNNFFGFRDIQFNAISVQTSSYNNVFILDNIQLPLPPDMFGTTLQVPASNSVFMAQNAQASFVTYLTNTTAQQHTATLATVNPHSNITASIASPNPVTVASGATSEPSILVAAGPSATPGAYNDLLLQVTTDDGTVLYSTINVTVQAPGTTPLPDLAVSATDISLASSTSTSANVMVNVHNLGNAASTQTTVQLSDFGSSVGQAQTLAAIPPNGVASVSFTFPITGGGDHLIEAVVTPIAESNTTNNVASTVIRISTPTNLDAGVEESGGILVTGSLPSVIYAASPFTVSGLAVYYLPSMGVTNLDYPVKGALVQIALVAQKDGSKSLFGGIHTDFNGNFSDTVLAPAAGIYTLKISVSDQTLSGTRELTLNVTPAPPVPPPPPSVVYSGWGGGGSYVPNPGGGDTWVWTQQPSVTPPASDLYVYSQNIFFSNDNPALNQEITIAAQIQYWASDSSIVATNVPIDVYEVNPTLTTKVLIGQTIIPSLSVASPDFGSRVVYATWMNPRAGFYIIEVDIGPTAADTDMSNNAATRAVIVGSSTDGAITGHVTGPWGGVANLEVDVNCASGSLRGFAFTDANGFYTMQPLPAGTWQVSVRPPSGFVPDATVKSVTLPQGTVSTVNFTIAAQSAVPAPIPRFALWLLAGVFATIGAVVSPRRRVPGDVTFRE